MSVDVFLFIFFISFTIVYLIPILFKSKEEREALSNEISELFSALLKGIFTFILIILLCVLIFSFSPILFGIIIVLFLLGMLYA